MSKQRVRIIQPTVPKYRAPLFDRLAEIEDLDVRVFACPKADGSPASSVSNGGIYDLGFQVSSVGGGRFRLMSPRRLMSGLTRGDVLVLWGDVRLLNNIGLLLGAKLKGIKTVWWGQGFTAGTAHRVGLRQRFMRRADVVLLYTEREVARYRELGFSHPRLFAKNNALDQAPIAAAREAVSEADLAATRSEYGLTPGKTLITVGRLTEKVRLDLALRALATPELADYKLLVVGSGDEEKSLRQLADELGVASRVVFVGAIYDESRLAPLMLASDIFVYPGAIGLSIFHAFGYGLPVVTHNDEVDQMPEFASLRPGVNGEVFEPNDVTGFSAAIQRLNIGERREALRADCLKTVSEEWSIETTVAKFAEAIRSAR